MSVKKSQTVKNPITITFYLFGIAMTTLATSPIADPAPPESKWIGNFTKSIDFSKLPSPASYYVKLESSPIYSLFAVSYNGDYEFASSNEFMICKEGETEADDCIPCPLDQECELNIKIYASSYECDLEDLVIDVSTEVHHQYDRDVDYDDPDYDGEEIIWGNLFENELDMVTLQKTEECDGEMLDQDLNTMNAGAEGSP